MLLPGAWVRVRSASEIAKTLDDDGCLDGLPFMPEMAVYCGRAFQVQLRAEHTCTFPYVGHRRLTDAVVLQSLRCDGAAHAGCQLGCMMFWKEAWLQAIPAESARVESSAPAPVFQARRRDDPTRYICQGTELLRATKPGPSKWEPMQYIELVRAKTLKPLEVVGFFTAVAGRKLARMRLAATPVPTKRNANGAPAALGLEPGDLVTVKSPDEIRATLDERGMVRGLLFAETMYEFCGRTMRVAAKVTRIIDERNGKVREFPPGTVLLEGALCDRYRGCARNLPVMWREAWLERADEAVQCVECPTAKHEACATVGTGDFS